MVPQKGGKGEGGIYIFMSMVEIMCCHVCCCCHPAAPPVRKGNLRQLLSGWQGVDVSVVDDGDNVLQNPSTRGKESLCSEKCSVKYS